MVTEKNAKRRERVFAFAPLFFWTALILVLGSGPGSSAETSRFIKPLIEFFFPTASPDSFLIVHALIRKTAHFVEYAILAFLAWRAFRRSNFPSTRSIAFSLFIVVAVAFTDEVNQSFQSSRTSSGWDVLLDISGGAFAMIVCFFIARRRQRSMPQAPK